MPQWYTCIPYVCLLLKITKHEVDGRKEIFDTIDRKLQILFYIVQPYLRTLKIDITVHMCNAIKRWLTKNGQFYTMPLPCLQHCVFDIDNCSWISKWCISATDIAHRCWMLCCSVLAFLSALCMLGISVITGIIIGMIILMLVFTTVAMPMFSLDIRCLQ